MSRRVVRRGDVAVHAALALLCVALLFPVAWAVLSSVTPTVDLFRTGLWPSRLTTGHYREALQAFPVVQLVTTTTVVAAATAGGQVAAALLLAWSVSKPTTPGRRLALGLAVASALVPQQALVLPNYILTARLGWLDSYAGLIVPQLGTLGVGVYFIRQHLRAFPTELLEAARLDGAGDWTVLRRIVVPLLRPTLLALAVVLFIQTWNEYLWPLLVADGIDRTTVQVGLRIFQTEEGTRWGPMLAAATMSSAPLLAVYVVVQHRIIDAFLHAGIR